MVEWLFADVLLFVLLLGFKGASILAIPISGLLFGAITFVSGRIDIDWLFGTSGSAEVIQERICLLAGILFKSLLLATADFEIGRCIAWSLEGAGLM